MDPPDPGPVFIIVDCPSANYIESIVKNNRFEKYQRNSGKTAAIVIHLVENEIFNNNEYKEWISR